MSEWDWHLTDTARRDFAGLDDYARDRIGSKLDEIGPFRLGCRVDRADKILHVLRIRKRGGDAYRNDDD